MFYKLLVIMRVFNYFLFVVLGIAIGWCITSTCFVYKSPNEDVYYKALVENAQIHEAYQSLIQVIYYNQPDLIEDWLCETDQWSYIDEHYGWDLNTEDNEEEEYDYGYED